MENYIEVLSGLAKEAATFHELEAVKTCLQIFRMMNKKNPALMRFCQPVDAAIDRRQLKLSVIYFDDSNIN